MKSNIKSISVYLTIVGASVQVGCLSPGKISNHKHKEIPKEFSTVQQSEPANLLNREEFFKDEQLKSLIKDVLNHNPDLNIALQRIEMAVAELRASKARLFPSVQGMATASGTKYGKYTMEGVGNYDTNLSPNIEDDQKVETNPTPNFWLGLSSSWEIDFWGKLRQLKKSAKQRLIASQEGVNWAKSQLVAQTARLYFELVCLDKELDIIDQNIILQSRGLEIVEAQKMGGRATELAVQQFKAQLLNTRSTRYSLSQQILETENQLNLLRGQYTGNIERSKEISFSQHFDEMKNFGIPSQMLLKRPDVIQAAAELKASKADVLAARAAFFPNISVSAYGAFNAFNSQLLFANGSLANQILSGLTAPIFQQHQLRAQFRITNAQQKAAFHQYEKTAINAYQEVVNQLKGLENLKEMVSLKKDEVQALEQGVSISNDLYITGYASYLEIVTAQKSKLDAQLQLINLQRLRINSHIGLYKALGGGWQ